MTDELPKAYRYTYAMRSRLGGWRHSYTIENRWGVIEFWVMEYPDKDHLGDQAGLECHFRYPPTYMEDRRPDHPQCDLLHGPCWHDGTSFYATETLLPLWYHNKGPEMFQILLPELKRLEEQIGGFGRVIHGFGQAVKNAKQEQEDHD